MNVSVWRQQPPDSGLLGSRSRQATIPSTRSPALCWGLASRATLPVTGSYTAVFLQLNRVIAPSAG